MKIKGVGEGGLVLLTVREEELSLSAHVKASNKVLLKVVGESMEVGETGRIEKQFQKER